MAPCPKNENIILSSIPIFKDNDLIIPFVRDGTKAYNSKGKEYTITSEALDKDFRSYENGHITINHKVLASGVISEVWRQKPFVYGRISGLSDEIRELILSTAYRGVSQESTPLTVSDSGDVMSLRGKGITLIFFPEQPACSREQGCGTIQTQNNFSLNSSQINSHIKNTGGIKPKMTEPTNTPPAAETIIQSAAVDDELTKAKELILKLQAEIAELKKGAPAMMSSAVTAALKEQAEQIESAAKYDAAKKDLLASMKKENAEKFLVTKPSLEQINSMTEVMKSMSPQAGAGSGEQINSSGHTNYEALNKRFMGKMKPLRGGK